MGNRLYIVVPCYNEEEVLPETAKRLRAKMDTLIASGRIGADSRVLFVNDGSTDNTWPLIDALHRADKLFSGLNLSRNRGHQNALLAGLLAIRDKADITISMDADLQDDIDAIDGMVEKYLDGCDVVYGVRSERATDTRFKRLTAEGYYKLMARMGVEVVFNHADYRLLSRRALLALSEYEESSLYLRGVIPLIGYRSDVVSYARGARYAGKSKYPFKKMLALAVDGITSLSIKPIRMIFGAGVFLLLLTLILLAVFLAGHFTGRTMLNWKIVTLAIFFVGGLLLLALGVIGEYVGKTYMETKRRPRYFIETILDDEK